MEKRKTTKDRLLALLEEHKGQYLSGEEIAEEMQISRTAIWKGVKSLQAQGYEIDGVKNRGYRLSEGSDIISGANLSKYLDESLSDLRLEFFSEISSTNDYLKEMAGKGEKEGLVAIAASQSKGKGRRGRSFYSPSGTGAYLSILLRPHLYDAAKASSFTTMAAVAVCEAVSEVSGQNAGIKWVNDVFLDEKKICGILTEAAFDLESNMLDYAVLGIGINVNMPKDGFPEEIKDVAGAIFNSPIKDGKNRIIAQVLKSFMSYYRGDDANAYKKTYREKSIALGKTVEVLSPNGSIKAKALDVDDDCHLIVKYLEGQKAGMVEALSSGEISIKLQ